jgi:hypothetical protein
MNYFLATTQKVLFPLNFTTPSADTSLAGKLSSSYPGVPCMRPIKEETLHG